MQPYLTIHGTSQNYCRRYNATSSFLKLLKYTPIKVVDNKNSIVVIVDHMLKTGVGLRDSAAKILQFTTAS